MTYFTLSRLISEINLSWSITSLNPLPGGAAGDPSPAHTPVHVSHLQNISTNLQADPWYHSVPHLAILSPIASLLYFDILLLNLLFYLLFRYSLYIVYTRVIWVCRVNCSWKRLSDGVCVHCCGWRTSPPPPASRPPVRQRTRPHARQPAHPPASPPLGASLANVIRTNIKPQDSHITQERLQVSGAACTGGWVEALPAC